MVILILIITASINASNIRVTFETQKLLVTANHEICNETHDIEEFLK